MLTVPSSGLCFTLDIADSRCGSRCALFQAKNTPYFSLLTNLFIPSWETTSCILIYKSPQGYTKLSSCSLQYPFPPPAGGDSGGWGGLWNGTVTFYYFKRAEKKNPLLSSIQLLPRWLGYTRFVGETIHIHTHHRFLIDFSLV